jgi:hypothetical protein
MFPRLQEHITAQGTSAFLLGIIRLISLASLMGKIFRFLCYHPIIVTTLLQYKSETPACKRANEQLPQLWSSVKRRGAAMAYISLVSKRLLLQLAVASDVYISTAANLVSPRSVSPFSS